MIVKKKRKLFSFKTSRALLFAWVIILVTQNIFFWVLSTEVNDEQFISKKLRFESDVNSVTTTTSACNGYDGMLHIRAGDSHAAGATVLFSYVINHIIYAERHNLVPWIHFDNIHNRYTYTNSQDGTKMLMVKHQTLDSGDAFIRTGGILLEQHGDGNLELQEERSRRVLWSSRRHSRRWGRFITRLQANCNLVTRRRHARKVLWASGSVVANKEEPCFLSYDSTGGAIKIHSGRLVLWQEPAVPIINMSTTSDDYFVANSLDLELKSKVVNPVNVTPRNGFECLNTHKTGLLPIPGPPSFGDSEETNITITGHGIWRSYFDPVSSFDWDDPTCLNLPVVQLPDDMIVSLHECDPNSVRSWVYDRVPKSLRPHQGRGSNGTPMVRPTVHDWLGLMREKAAAIVKKYYRPLPWLQSRIDSLVRSFGEKDCLAMHIRHTDKGAGRQKIPTQAFLPYAEAYVRAGGECIFLATDSDKSWSEISRLWPLAVVRRIIVQEGAFRSPSDKPTFVQKDPSRINTEILTDIYAMSGCSFLLHGFSAVSEAVIYLNPALHNNSVNLDLKEFAATPEEFGRTVSDRLNRPPLEASQSKLCFNYSMVPHDFVLQNYSFLPDPFTSSCYSSDDFKAQSLHFDIHERQNLDSCIGSKQLYIADNGAFGFGSTLNSWVKPFMYALDNKIQFLSPALGPYSFGKEKTLIDGTHCGVNSASCWFEDVAGCKTTSRGVSESIRRIDPRNEKAITKTYSLLHRGSDIDGYPTIVPAEYRKMGLFWYFSQLLAYLMRPNYKFRRHLETVKKKLNWDVLEGPVLSLHIRHGDACTGIEPKIKSRRCDDLNTYMESVFHVAKRYGVKSIYLSTDDQAVIDGTNNYTEFTWLYQKLDTSSRSVIEWDRIEDLGLSTFALAQELLIDIFLLSEGDIFVGKFTSNVDRIAYALMTVRKSGLAPYLSLDSPWCFDWGVKSGKSLFGEFDC